MKILADFHHGDLFESHQLVFGDRFGYEVYAPYGLEWFEEDIWAFERAVHGDAVARQYLLGIFGAAPPDANGIVRAPDAHHPGRTLTGITLAAARDAKLDLVMSSVPANAIGFRRFARETAAGWLMHIGNQWGNEDVLGISPDGAIVTTTSDIGAIPHVVVHQEFSLADFRYEPPTGFGAIASCVNCFPEMTTEYQDNFIPTVRALPEYDWRVYGAYGTAPLDDLAAGNLDTTAAVADAMRGAAAGWHAKHWSDGFGHVLHNWFAVGRPVFGYQRYYADKIGGPLWVEGETSFDVETKSVSEIAGILARLRDEPDYHRALCENAARRFREIVDFDADAELVRGLVERVLTERLVAA